MLHPYHLILPLLSLFVVRVDLTDCYPVRLPVDALRALDGDTLEVRSGRRVLRLRLSRIDAPEMSQSTGPVSRACLVKVLRSLKPGIMEWHGRDMYGRVLGELEGLTPLLLKEGCSSLYKYAEFKTESEKWEAIRAVREARRERRGVWSRGGHMDPYHWRRISKRGADQRSHRRGHSRGTYRPGRRSS